jgi:hypothetical protein
MKFQVLKRNIPARAEEHASVQPCRVWRHFAATRSAVADHVGCRTRREQVSRVGSATGIIAKSTVGRRWLGCGWQARLERL